MNMLTDAYLADSIAGHSTSDARRTGRTPRKSVLANRSTGAVIRAAGRASITCGCRRDDLMSEPFAEVLERFVQLPTAEVKHSAKIRAVVHGFERLVTP